MTASERATAGSVRSAHVAHFLPPDWSRVARLAAPALERSARDASAPQLLIIVPDATASVALARALSALPASEGRRIVAATSAARVKRMLAAGPAQCVIGSPAALAPALTATVLKLDQVTTVMFAAADELDADDADIATIVTEVPKGAARILTALEATEGVEALIERHMHKARRVTEDTTTASDDAASNVRFLTVGGSPVEALALVLDEVDAPTATVIATDDVTADAARATLRAIGHGNDALGRVTDGEVAENTALVIVLGVPTGTVWAQIVAAKPAQVVAIIAPRQRASLQRLVGEETVLPFAARAAVLKARASEAKVRAELRDVLASGIPSREVLALEPMLGEYDGLEIAAAALRLLDIVRAKQDEMVRTAEGRVRAQMKEAAAAEREEARGSERGGPRGFAPRGDKPRGFAPRGGSDRGGDRPPRKFPPRDGGERGDREGFPLREPRAYAPREGGDKARGYVPRASADKPRGFAPRSGGDKPRGFAPRGDKPRGPRRDDDRGPRGPRGPR